MPDDTDTSGAPRIGHECDRGTIGQAHPILWIQLLVAQIPSNGFDYRNQFATANIEAIQVHETRKQVVHVLGDEGIADLFVTLEEGFENQRDGDDFAVGKTRFGTAGT